MSGSALADLVTTEDELLPGETMTAPPAARTIGGARSVGYCGLPFPSEALRTDRHQVTILDAGGDWAGVTEAISYRPGGAARAVAELRRALRNCPDDEYVTVPADRPGAPDFDPQRFQATPLTEQGWSHVAPDHVASELAFTTTDGTTSRSYVVLQRRDDVAILTIAPNEERVVALAEAAGRRLAAAPQGSLGG